jgi:hypothetical protein
MSPGFAGNASDGRVRLESYCCERNSRIRRRSFSSLMRVKSFVPSVVIVCCRSNGRRSYIVPPAKWHGWHLASRMGLICALKSTLAATGADGAELASALIPDAYNVVETARCLVRPQLAKPKASVRIRIHTRIVQCYASQTTPCKSISASVRSIVPGLHRREQSSPFRMI